MVQRGTVSSSKCEALLDKVPPSKSKYSTQDTISRAWLRLKVQVLYDTLFGTTEYITQYDSMKWHTHIFVSYQSEEKLYVK